MTEEEKVRLRSLKADTAAWLQRDRDAYPTRYRCALVETDRRIGDYVYGVIDNPERHNLYELLAVKRFFRMLDRYEWSPKRVKHFFRFYQALRFRGINGRTRYKLTPVQAFQFANIFGFVKPDGRRLIRSVYLFVPASSQRQPPVLPSPCTTCSSATTTHRLT